MNQDEHDLETIILQHELALDRIETRLEAIPPNADELQGNLIRSQLEFIQLQMLMQKVQYEGQLRRIIANREQMEAHQWSFLVPLKALNRRIDREQIVGWHKQTHRQQPLCRVAVEMKDGTLLDPMTGDPMAHIKAEELSNWHEPERSEILDLPAGAQMQQFQSGPPRQIPITDEELRDYPGKDHK